MVWTELTVELGTKMHAMLRWTLAVVVTFGFAASAMAQALGEPDRGEPGDRMIQDYLARVTTTVHDRFADDLASLETWQARRAKYRDEYLYMLGLSPLPERTPLMAAVTGTLAGDGYTVELLHYQSRQGLYVTGNLYRPALIKPGDRLPAVFYVCGHSGRGRDGNKTAFQSHGIWFARHGYVCLVVDTLQLGEIRATHHGTYSENRWWWHSRGYTPAGVECWNGVRGIDYLVSRPDVDPARIAVTGISGGGAATFWIAAADERVRVAVPVSGMADLPSYVTNRVINGHCDCMFLYNTFEWPWARIAGLIAPRPMLFVNSDQDGIFPMDANDRVINRLERLYSLYGAGDQVDAVVSVGGHAYREDIRKAVYRFINLHLKQDARPIADSEADLAVDPPAKQFHPIEPRKLRVFSEDVDIPADQLNTTIDQHFVPLAKVAVPGKGEFESWKEKLVAELRRVAFRTLPDRVPAGKVVKQESPEVARLETEPGIMVRLRAAEAKHSEPAKRIILVVQSAAREPADASASDADARESLPAFVYKLRRPGDYVYDCQPRGVGDTRWTIKNPPNYVARSHVLLGRTVDTGRVCDVIATARRLREMHPNVPIVVAGYRTAGIIAAYAALWESEIAEVIAYEPPATHMDSQTPKFLNVLRVADIPEMLGLLAPRPLTLLGESERFAATAAIYAAAGATDRLALKPHASNAKP